MTSGKIAEFLASVGFKADEKSLASALTRVAAFGAAVKIIAAGVTAGIMRVAESQVAVAKDAEKLRTPVERLEELRYVAEQTGAESATLDAALKGLGDRYPRIRDTSVLFDRLGAAMSRMTEQQQKAYARRMGIDPSLIPMLTRDVSGLSAEFKQMYALAGADAKQATEASRGFLAEIGKLKTLAVTLARAVSLAFIGRVRGDIEMLRRAVMDNFGSIRQVLEFIVGLVLRISGVISAFVYRAIKVISGLVDWFANLDEGTRTLITGAGLLLAAWRLLNLGFLATPLGAVIGLLTTFVALVDDYLTWMEGGESYFDWSPCAETINQVVQAMQPIIGLVKGIGQGIVASITPALQSAIANAKLVLNWFKVWGQYMYALFSGDFARAAELGGKIFSGFRDIVVGVFSGMVETIKAFFLALWPSVQENFPDFAAWAEKSAAAITGLLGKAIAWVKEQLGALLDYMPDWIKDSMGLGSGGAPASGPSGVMPDYAAPALTPSPAAAANMTHSSHQTVQMTAKTDIHMHTSDPIAAGNQAAARQGEVNAATVRNMKGSVR